jgi:hypothetical protein
MVHQILPETRILPDNSAVGRATVHTGLINPSRHIAAGSGDGTEA